MTKSNIFGHQTTVVTERSLELDVIIIGGGPAGLSAELWCGELGLSSILFEKENELGGQLLWTFNPIRNHLGIKAENGRALRDMFVNHLLDREGAELTRDSVVNTDLAHGTIRTAGGMDHSARAMIIATGVRRRTLGISGEVQFRGRGILASGVESRDQVDQKTVMIVGGGDAALENAIILSEKAKKVYVVHRGHCFSARNSFVEEGFRRANVEFLTAHRLISLEGDDIIRSAMIENIDRSESFPVHIDHLLIRIGVAPNTEIFKGQIDLDDKGYIIANSRGETSIRNIYAAGDVTNSVAPTISSAVGSGAVAAKSILAFLAGSR